MGNGQTLEKAERIREQAQKLVESMPEASKEAMEYMRRLVRASRCRSQGLKKPLVYHQVFGGQ